jgi:hypothetical protein
MERTSERGPMDGPLLARSVATSAGDVTIAVRAELSRLLAAHDGNRRKAVPAGLEELVKRKAVSRAEASELAAIIDSFFDAPSGIDTKLAERVRAYHSQLVLDPESSPTALAIVSVVNTLVTPSSSAGGAPARLALSKGDAVFGGFGALVGAGIGSAFGPLGAGIGAAVGAAVGLCVEKG